MLLLVRIMPRVESIWWVWMKFKLRAKEINVNTWALEEFVELVIQICYTWRLAPRWLGVTREQLRIMVCLDKFVKNSILPPHGKGSHIKVSDWKRPQLEWILEWSLIPPEWRVELERVQTLVNKYHVSMHYIWCLCLPRSIWDVCLCAHIYCSISYSRPYKPWSDNWNWNTQVSTRGLVYSCIPNWSSRHTRLV